MTSEPIPGLSAKEAAGILDVTSQTVHKMVCAGIIHKGEKHARGGLDRDAVEQVSLATVAAATTAGTAPVLGDHPGMDTIGTSAAISLGASQTPA